MGNLYNVSSSPHTRDKISTSRVMLDVIIGLLPATIMGIYNFGVSALLIILASIITAELTEYVFNLIVKKPITNMDGSAAVTGLLLALCLPNGVPLYIPIIGSIFAILVVKCLFGGLGKNFMNPALAARCFLLISFSGAMTAYKFDGVTCATPLEEIASGSSVNVWNMFIGTTNGVIGCSIAGLLIGGVYLLVAGIIDFEIPLATLLSFALFVAIFGGHGFNPTYLLSQICGGGIVMAAFFMATDYVTSPVSSLGHVVYGCCVGIISGLFRVFASSADSVSYAVIISNLFVPLIDEYIVPKPYAFRAKKEVSADGKKAPLIPKPAVVLCVITLIAGVALSGVYTLTKDRIAEQEREAQIASYKEVVPEAVDFQSVEAADQVIAELDGGVYGTDYGKAYINEAYVGVDADGNPVGYVVSATSGDGFDGTITLAVGFDTEGTINGISFTELHETAGMGMKCGEEEFSSQFNGKNVEAFTLNKSGGSTEDDQIDSVSGASVSSGAVVNAVNAAIDFCRNNLLK